MLTISAERSALFGGSGKALSEHAAQGFPREQEPDQPDVERKERIGDVPSTFRDEQTRHFIREADAALGAVLETDPRAVYVAGDAPALAVLGEVGTAAKTAVAHVVRGGLAHASAAVVRDAVSGAVAEQGVRAVAQAKERLSQAKGARSLAAGIDEVWRSVSEGRAALVVLEEHYWEPVLVTDNHLVPARGGTPDVREDMVDEIVERALDTGAQVQFVPTDELVEHGRIAAVLRY